MIAWFAALFLALQAVAPPAGSPSPNPGPAAVASFKSEIETERAHQSALPPAASDSERLIRMAAIDQAARHGMQARLGAVSQPDRAALRRLLWPEVEAVDQANQAELLALLPPEGWFGRGRYGAEASRAAFLIVQHSGEPMWERFLPVLEPLVASGEIPGEDYALMYDRLQMSRGLPQRYGTQITCPHGTGKWAVWTLEDPTRVDEWRASMGMGTLESWAGPFLANPPPFC